MLCNSCRAIFQKGSDTDNTCNVHQGDSARANFDLRDHHITAKGHRKAALECYLCFQFVRAIGETDSTYIPKSARSSSYTKAMIQASDRQELPSLLNFADANRYVWKGNGIP